MNQVQLTGRLTSDVEVRYTKTETPIAVAEFNIAIDRPTRKGEKNKADFPRIVVWGKQAENCAKYTGKGKLVAIVGSVETAQYQDKDGKTQYTTKIRAERVEFMEWKDAPKDQPTQNTQEPQSFQPVEVADDDLDANW